MIDQRKADLKYLHFFLLLLLLLGVGNLNSYGQDPTIEANELSRIALPQTQDITSFYTYDPEQDVYIFSTTISDFPIGTP